MSADWQDKSGLWGGRMALRGADPVYFLEISVVSQFEFIGP
jgi:hypothetical protein